jgi:hypothetical protein
VQRWQQLQTAAAQGQPQQRARQRVVVVVVLMLRVLLVCVPAPAASWTPFSGAAASSTPLQSSLAQQQLAAAMPGVCLQSALVQCQVCVCRVPLYNARCVSAECPCTMPGVCLQSALVQAIEVVTRHNYFRQRALIACCEQLHVSGLCAYSERLTWHPAGGHTSHAVESKLEVLANVCVHCCRTPGTDGKPARAGRIASSGPDQVLAADGDRDV